MSKQYLDDLPTLDIRTKSKTMKGFLATMHGITEGSAFVAISGFNGQINYETTRCNYGGLRYWWVCPGCGRRCAVLRVYDRWLQCNNCIDLPFKVASITKSWRAMDRRDELLSRLEDWHSLLEPLAECHKPTGMHWKTFRKIMIEYNRLYEQDAKHFNKKAAAAGMASIY